MSSNCFIAVLACSLVSVGDEVWSASADRNIIAWQGDTGAMLHKVQAHDNRVLCLVKVIYYFVFL